MLAECSPIAFVTAIFVFAVDAEELTATVQAMVRLPAMRALLVYGLLDARHLDSN